MALSIQHGKAIGLLGEETDNMFSLSRQRKFTNGQAHLFLQYSRRPKQALPAEAPI